MGKQYLQDYGAISSKLAISTRAFASTLWKDCDLLWSRHDGSGRWLELKNDMRKTLRLPGSIKHPLIMPLWMFVWAEAARVGVGQAPTMPEPPLPGVPQSRFGIDASQS